MPTVLVSKDINLRIKADAHGLQAEDYETDRVQLKDLYTGMRERTVNAEKMAQFRANEELALEPGQNYYPNEYCTLFEEGNAKRLGVKVSLIDEFGEFQISDMYPGKSLLTAAE